MPRRVCNPIPCSILLQRKHSPRRKDPCCRPLTSGAGLDRSGQRDQFDDLPSVQWQFENSGVLDNLADAHASCFHQRRVRLNFNLFTDLADFQDRID